MISPHFSFCASRFSVLAARARARKWIDLPDPTALHRSAFSRRALSARRTILLIYWRRTRRRWAQPPRRHCLAYRHIRREYAIAIFRIADASAFCRIRVDESFFGHSGFLPYICFDDRMTSIINYYAPSDQTALPMFFATLLVAYESRWP